MSRHRGRRVRARYGRIAVLGSSVAVTAIAVLGGTGLLPSAATTHPPRAAAADRAVAQPSRAPVVASRGLPRPAHSGVSSEGSPDAVEVRTRTTLDRALPLRSGEGKRVVFSQNRQRVWLVDSHDRVRRTYPVSGSVYDNLSPGTYSVYSRSEQAWGIDDSGTMKYFVRFAHGENAAIGFHDIPIAHGHLVQSVTALGTPQSHGCVRQRRIDAIALWRFAPIGTTVVVV